MQGKAKILRNDASEALPTAMLKRFAWAVSSDQQGCHSLADRDLDSLPECVVAPSLGAIVPGWLLLIPRKPVLSIRHLPDAERQTILARAHSVAQAFGNSAQHVAIFEHGPGEYGSRVGCGVDQAHLHVVPLSFDLAEYSRRHHPSLQWYLAAKDDPWRRIPPGSDYYLVAGATGVYVSETASMPSQFFRRMIADAVGKAEEWDYRQHPHDGNITATIEHYATISPGAA